MTDNFPADSGSTNELLSQAIEAHGGLERWKQIVTIECDVASTGELFRSKRVEAAGGTIHFVARTTEQVCSVTLPASPGPALRSVGRAERVSLESPDGQLLAELLEPRSSFTGHDLHTPWTPLQRLYFSSYAMWNYLTAPFAQSIEGAQVWDIDPLEEDASGETWRGVRVVLPPRFATHSRAIEYYFGDDGLIRRQDYTLDIASGLRIANYAHDIVEVNGLKVASKRRAYLCNKKYEVQRDRLLVSLDFTNLRASETRGAIF